MILCFKNSVLVLVMLFLKAVFKCNFRVKGSTQAHFMCKKSVLALKWDFMLKGNALVLKCDICFITVFSAVLCPTRRLLIRGN